MLAKIAVFAAVTLLSFAFINRANAQACAAATPTWGTPANCSGPVSTLGSGAQQTVTNTAKGYTGTETATCTAGNLTYTNSTCTVSSESSNDTFTLGSVQFGPALAATFGSKKNVTTAATEGTSNIVRVTAGSKDDFGLWAEIHVPMAQWGSHLKESDNSEDPKNRSFGFAPFTAVQVTSSTGGTINGVALGGMFQFRPATEAVTGNTSFNLGLGYSLTKIQQLGDGIQEGLALPAGVSSIYYKTGISRAPIFVFSLTWKFF